MTSPVFWRRVRRIAAAVGLAVTLAAPAQTGLPVRPLNQTCVAPDAPAVRYTLKRVDASRVAVNSLTRASDAGVLYRGRQAPGVQGLFLTVAGDGRNVIATAHEAHGALAQPLLADGLPGARIDAAGEGTDNEFYLRAGPELYRLVAESDPLPENFPTLLSATGCFDVNDITQAAPGVIPFTPSATLWSDGAVKRRWLALPDWLAADTKIELLPDGDFEFPAGTVLIKEFALGATRVETRLLIRHTDGVWAGYSYEWNAGQTDAVLLESGKTVEVAGQTWSFPSRFQCLNCHSAAANRSLGPEIAQLNHAQTYPSTGITANQLETLDAIGLFDGGLPAPVAQLDRLPYYDDEAASVVDRARGYLHSNCAGCHRPGGPGIGPEDFRYQLASDEIGAWDVTPWLGTLGVPGAVLLRRGVPEESVLALRMRHQGAQRMPPLGVSIMDDDGVALVERWIRSGLGFGIADSDGDERTDDLDNCSILANADQRDTDGDGYGNACDADLNNDEVVNVADLGLFRSRFFSADPDADFNGDGVVNAVDLGVMRGQFFGPPGPGAVELAGH